MRINNHNPEGYHDPTPFLAYRNIKPPTRKGRAYRPLDCEAKLAYTEPLILRTSHLQGKWLTLPAGTSSLLWTGSITSVQITPRWRMLS